MKFRKPWGENYIDEMGLIIALGGEERFEKLRTFKERLSLLSLDHQILIKKMIQERFTPTNGQDGCFSGMKAIQEVTL